MGSDKKPDPPRQRDLFGARSATGNLLPGTSAKGAPTGNDSALVHGEEGPPPFELLERGADDVAPQQRGAALQQIGSVAPPSTIGPVAAGKPVGLAAATEAKTYRVVEIVRLASRALETRFSDVWIEGELSNFKAVNGNLYFTLKDAEAQLPSMMFRSDAQRLKFHPADGQKVRARGSLRIYEPQGKVQLYVTLIEPAGLGALQLAFEQRKAKLAAEGLFDESRKRPLPFLPRRIGVATSATGAAVRDIVRVATRRGPVRILIAACQVQGESAPAEIVRAIAALERQPDIDLIIVGRGGGSIEDLWAFNDEAVARAIARCRVPVISAVGHEVDFTIADFVADRRAATPSQAAELAVPVHDELVSAVVDLTARLARSARHRIGDSRQRLDGELGRAAAMVQRSIGERRQSLRAAERRLALLHPAARVAVKRAVLVDLRRRLRKPLPDRAARSHKEIAALQHRLYIALQQQVERRRRALAGAAGKLDALSPLKVLERGYSLVRGDDGHLISSARQLKPGESVRVTLARGGFVARVEGVEPDDGAGER